MQDEPITAEEREDTLHLGGTRPAMFGGLPIILAVAIAVAGYEIQAAFGNLQGIAWALAICTPLWFAARWAIGHDLYGINVIVAATRLYGLSFDRETWGGGSRHPLPAAQPGRARGMRHV
jgi:type IV secretory pathway VirB3-like protein